MNWILRLNFEMSFAKKWASKTRTIFESFEIEKKQKWDEAFIEYYETFVKPDADCIGRWKLEDVGFYNSYSGLTTNISEGI